MRVKRDVKGLEQRRLRGARMLKRGMAQAEVARACGVSRNAVSLWAKALTEGGSAALRASRLGRPAGLDDAQRAQLVQALKGGALAHGYATELWTLARIGKTIQRLFGMRYSQTQVWRILRQLGWSCQRPAARAIERDEQAIRRWKYQRWPALKKTPRASAG
jgi:transposase